MPAARRKIYALNTSNDVSLTSAYQAQAILAVPRGLLSGVFVRLTNISTASQILWYLATDAAGDEPISPVYTSTIVTGATTATKGGIGQAADIIWAPVNTAQYNTASLYIVYKTNAGTATATRTWITGEHE